MGLVNIRNSTVLLAEGNSERRSALEKLLKDSRFTRVVVVATGAEAVKLYSQVKADIVILDDNLPDIPALDLVRAFRGGSKKLGLVAVCNEEKRGDAERAGASRVLTTAGGKELVAALDALMMKKLGISSGSVIPSEE